MSAGSTGSASRPDSSSEGLNGRAARHAAAKVLGRELGERADALVAAADDAITLAPNGRILWAGSEIARLERGESVLKPKLQIYSDEHLGSSERERMAKRLHGWLEAHLAARIKPLVALSEATDLAGLARGLAFRLTENLGTLRRDAVADEVKALDQNARAQLRAYGIRFGAFNIYIPALLKPAAADLLLLLWALYAGREHGIDSDSMPPRPQQGLTSVEADRRTPEPYWHAAGFQLVGSRAVRIDMLERLSDLIRARVTWRAAPAEGAAVPSGATGDGGFRVAPELMSVVGCSGEDFASILTALGFRRSRQKLPVVEAVAPEATVADAAAQDGAPVRDASAPDESTPAVTYDEIWRPAKRRNARHDSKGHGNAAKARQGRKSARPPRQGAPVERTHKERASPPEHSPFAALKELRQSLLARRQDG